MIRQTEQWRKRIHMLKAVRLGRKLMRRYDLQTIV
jgi:hypothetical protein